MIEQVVKDTYRISLEKGKPILGRILGVNEYGVTLFCFIPEPNVLTFTPTDLTCVIEALVKIQEAHDGNDELLKEVKNKSSIGEEADIE